MSDTEKELKNNWNKAVCGLIFVKQGLEGVSLRTAEKQHTYLLKKLPVTEDDCQYCNEDNLLPSHYADENKVCPFKQKNKCFCSNPNKRRFCPANKFCSEFYDLILEEHRFGDPIWMNSNISEWKQKPWSVACCFIDSPGDKGKPLAQVDCPGLLSLFINSKFFATELKIPDIDGKTDIFYKTREAWTELLQSENENLTANDLELFLALFMELLQSLGDDKDVQAAKDRLNKLRLGEFEMSADIICEIERQRSDAISKISETVGGAKKGCDETGQSSEGYIQNMAQDSRRNLIGNKEVEGCVGGIEEGSTDDRENWSKMSIFNNPMCLITVEKSGAVEINEDTLSQVASLKASLVVVGVAGPYRCGKSFLMNQLAGKINGFAVENTVNAVTKGIWALCVPHPSQKNVVMLLLDTEGLGDIKKGNKKCDNSILTLITLLCNVLIYNMMGRLDQDSMGKLSFASEISKRVRYGKGDMKGVLAPFMPELILCLRDSYLKLDGSPDEYFEDCLESINDSEYDLPRESLKKFFQHRKCVMFPTPAEDSLMQRLHSLEEKDLKKSFLAEARKLADHIHSCKPKSMLFSKSVHGAMFQDLLLAYTKHMKKGAIPDIEDAFMIASRKENEAIAERVMKEFMSLLNKMEHPIRKTDQAEKQFQTIQWELLETCRKEMVLDKDSSAEKKLQKSMDAAWKAKKDRSSKQLVEENMEILTGLHQKMFENHRNKFSQPGGYGVYRTKMNELHDDYCGYVTYNELEKQLAWSKFLAEKRDEAKSIYETDTNAEKQKLRQQMKDNELRMQKQIEDLQKSHRKDIEEYKQLLAEEQKKSNEQRLKQLEEDLRRFKDMNLFNRLKYLFTSKLPEA